MPLSPTELRDLVRAAEGPDGRLPRPSMAGWETCPFEHDGLRVVPLQEPEVPEQPRADEDPATCRACAAERPAIWSDDAWRLLSVPSGSPLLLMLVPRAHHDLPDLPDALAAQLGVLSTHLARAVEGLPHVARAHVYRVGDGGAHLHVWVYARPEGFEQLKGSFFAVWDDVLPPPPDDVRAADERAVAEALAASFGGVAH